MERFTKRSVNAKIAQIQSSQMTKSVSLFGPPPLVRFIKQYFIVVIMTPPSDAPNR